MCGIGGIAFLKGHTVKEPEAIKSIVSNLADQLTTRGRDATGIAYTSNEKISVVKHNVPGREFVNSEAHHKAMKKFIDGEDKAFGRLSSVLVHTRAQTKGTHENRDNNHPIVSGRVIGVHNGVISNDEELFQDYTKAFPKLFTRKAKVDTEIIFRLLNHYIYTISEPVYDAIESTHKALTGGWACAFVAASMPWMLYLFKNSSPTAVLHYTLAGLVIFASDEFSIKRSVAGLDLGPYKEIEYPRSSAIAINTEYNTMSKFDLNSASEARAAMGYGYA